MIIISTVRSQPELIRADFVHKLGFLRNPKRLVCCQGFFVPVANDRKVCIVLLELVMVIIILCRAFIFLVVDL